MTLACGVVLGGGTVTVTEQLFAPTPAANAATSVSGIINSYQAVSAVSGTKVTVTGSVTGKGTAFAVGDKVMLIQMTGVSPAVSESNFGHYDVTTITAISGSTITLAAIAKGYSPSTEKVQLVRTYSDTGTTTVTADVKAKAWDGSTGGIIAMSGQTLSLTKNIDASGTGFTNANRPTLQNVASLTSGAGQATGRGFDGLTAVQGESKGIGGGGVGGGGGKTGKSQGGGMAGGATDGNGKAAAGADGGDGVIAGTNGEPTMFDGAGGAAGGGGGLLGGGGGGGGAASGGGGGTDGGGSGGSWEGIDYDSGYGAGGGAAGSVGNGGNGPKGGPNASYVDGSELEGGAGGGGGSYGGGGGAGANFEGGEEGAGGGGGGSWYGGGKGGAGGQGFYDHTYPRGGDGNARVASAVPDSRNGLNPTNPYLIMGGAGGKGSQESGASAGGAGGGVIYMEFNSITSTGGKIVSNGAAGVSPAGGGAHSGSGAGGGGQMRIRAATIASPLTVSASGGAGGKATANGYHAGIPGSGGGGGGIWLETSGASASCPATSVSNVTFAISGGSAASPIINPKSVNNTSVGGNGGDGLACVTKLADPSLSTVATDKADGDHQLSQSGGVVRDTLNYKDLTPNASYAAKGTLWDKATAKATTITASKTFTASSTGSGSVDVEFTVPAGYDGAMLVAYESIYDSGNAVVVSHEDLADTAQTVSVADLSTVATDKADGDHTMTGAGGVISDVLTYKNLVPNASYTVNGTLWDKASTSATSITATKTFTASSTGSGSVTVEFTVPSGFGGKTLVAYERVLSGSTVVASHESIGDSNQTVTLQVKPLIVNKVDETGRLIDGATFGLCQEVVAQVICTGLPGFTQTAAGVFSITTLPAGTYQLKETAAPDGFTALADPVRFTVAADGSIALLSSSQDVSLSDQTITVRDHAIPMDIVKVGSDGGTVVPLKGAAFLVFPFSGYDNQAHVVVPDDLAPAPGVWYRVNPAELAAYQRVQSSHPSWSIAFTSDPAVPSGTVRLAGLAPMTVYALVEMVAPAGHALLAEPVVFALDSGRGVRIAAESFHPEATATANTMTISDPASIILPFTGANVGWQYSLFGGVVLVLGIALYVLLLLHRRRRNGARVEPVER